MWRAADALGFALSLVSCLLLFIMILYFVRRHATFLLFRHTLCAVAALALGMRGDSVGGAVWNAANAAIGFAGNNAH
jgi:hypothetical protein